MDFLLDLNVWRFMGALGFVIFMAWGVIFFIKKLKIFPSTQTEGKYLHFLDRLPLDTHRRLILVSCHQQTVLILLSPKGDRMIPLSTPWPLEK